MANKREDYITWDEYFMGVAILSGQRSKDPNTQVGCCIVSQDNKILSMGYNGLPIGCSDEEFPWNREGGGSPGDQVCIYRPQRAQCHPELQGRQPGGGQAVCVPLPLQRVRQGDHPERHQGSHL